jgi:VanZ family protein
VQTSFTNKYRIAIWVIFICALAALAYGIFRSSPPERLFENSDKVGHFIAFFGVSFIGRFALHKIPAILYWGCWLGLAGLLEYLQGELRPMRHFSVEDAYANAIGVAIAIVAMFSIQKLFLNKK